MIKLFLVLFLLLLVGCSGGGEAMFQKLFPHDINVPLPAVLRTDLLYGYYGCYQDQVTETIDHINLFMESQFSGPDKAVANILQARLPTVLDVSIQVFEKRPGAELKTLKPTVEDELRAFLTLLQSKGALHYVKYIYPEDEPNITMATEVDLDQGIAIIKRVAAEFPELAGVKYMVIYATGKPYVAFDKYDIVGIDDYGQKSGILIGPDYTYLKNNLLPWQKTVLVPGGAGNWGQDPVPFVNYAEGNSEVAMVLPFIWFDNLNGASDSTLGIRSGPLKQAYIDAGKLVISASPKP